MLCSNRCPNENAEKVVDYDEIKQYLNCRYISSQEATWHLQDFPIHGQFHSVVMLSIHLKDGQSIFFKKMKLKLLCDENQSYAQL